MMDIKFVSFPFIFISCIFANSCNDSIDTVKPSISPITDVATARIMSLAHNLTAIEAMSSWGGTGKANELSFYSIDSSFNIKCTALSDSSVLQEITLIGSSGDFEYTDNDDKTPSKRVLTFKPGNNFGKDTGNNGYQNQGGVGNPPGISPKVLNCNGTSGFPQIGWVYSNNVAQLKIEEGFKSTIRWNDKSDSENPFLTSINSSGSNLTLFLDPLSVPPYADNNGNPFTPAKGYVDTTVSPQTLTITKLISLGDENNPNRWGLIFANDKKEEKDIAINYYSDQSNPLKVTIVRNISSDNWPWISYTIASGKILSEGKFGNKVVSEFSSVKFINSNGCTPIEGVITHTMTGSSAIPGKKTVILRYGTSITSNLSGSAKVTEEIRCEGNSECKPSMENENKVYEIPFCEF